jgi:aminoglycoside 3-N-acetyltransferase
MYDLNGWVLLLGVGHGSNTSLHLAEYRAAYSGKLSIRDGAPMTVKGRRRWMEFEDLDGTALDFTRIGEDFARGTKIMRQGNVACATALLFPQRLLVDYAVQWMETNR